MRFVLAERLWHPPGFRGSRGFRTTASRGFYLNWCTMQKTYITALAALVLGCFAASAAPVDNCGFEKVPRDALVALHESRGKPFTAGAVFVNGKYLKPPYVVSRYGTAIVINGHQVTGQLIPWSKFTGARVASAARSASDMDDPSSAYQSEAGGSTGKYEEAKSLDELFEDDPGTSGAPAAPQAEAAPADTSDDDDDALDDLFGDDPPKPKAQPKPKPRPAPRAQPSAVARAAQDSDPATPPEKFEHNARTKQLLETIDKQRTMIDRTLRANHFYFFSPRYASVGGNLRTLGSMAEKLPDAMKDSTSPDDLFARMRKSGLGFVSMEVCTDLYVNRLTFPAIYELRNRIREEISRQKALTSEVSY